MPPAQDCSSGLSREGRALAFAHSVNTLADPPESRVVPMSITEIFVFGGSHSVLSPDEEEHPFTIEGREYRSISDFYRRKMFAELTDGRLPYEREQGAEWRSLLTRNGVSGEDFDCWFLQRGLLYLQWAVLQRAIEHERVRTVLMAVGSRYVLYTNTGDLFYGTGQDFRSSIRKWEEEQPFNVYAMVPTAFPLTAASLPFLPNLWAGRNVLGTILMSLRHKMVEGVPLASLCPRIPEWPSAPPRDDALEPPARRHSARFVPYGSSKRAGGAKLQEREEDDVDVRRFVNPARAVATPPPLRPKTPTPPKGVGRRRSSLHWKDELEIREDSVARNNRPPRHFEREGAPSPPSPWSRL
ncbi:hypothetical protein M3Y99_01896200 [Aphelenchoides fujianensis]|nr:hypothetical protein M3Y99_01896200 [Aphelenchoides fujianensis]